MGRIGADYWQNIFLVGLKSGGFLRPGMPVSLLLYPGPDGAETSQRFEAMREGVQETDARIYVEQAMVRKLLPAELAKKANEVLFEHNRSTLFLPVGGGVKHFEYTMGWQERSRRIFEVATEVAKVVPFDIDKSSVAVNLPARGQERVILKLRNWTEKPRAWKAESATPWIKLATTSGTLAGHTDLFVTLDAKALKPDSKVKGTLTVTDTASGKAFPVEITASVSKVFEYLPPGSKLNFRYWPDKGSVVFDVKAGKSLAKEVSILNRAGSEIEWKSEVVGPDGKPIPWIKVTPPAGKASALTPLILPVTATPPGAGNTAQKAVLRITESGGAAVEIPMMVYSIPVYAKPELPKGEAVILTGKIATPLQPNLKDKRRVWGARPVKKYGDCGPKGERQASAVCYIGKEYYAHAARYGTPQRTTFKLEGSGYKSFSAIVGMPDTYGMRRYGHKHDCPPWVRLNFEVFVDGKLRAQSGMMGPVEKGRLLVVEGLENAKTMTFRVRMNGSPGIAVYGMWANPTLYK